MVEAKRVNTVVIGAGQAGVSLSYHLSRRNIEHVVLERDRPFSAWYGRWDNFRANTPNWMSELPGGGQYKDNHADSFAGRQELLEYFEQYLRLVDPPLRLRTEVLTARQNKHRSWCLTTSDTEYHAQHVAVCTGAMDVPFVPVLADGLDSKVPQLHSSSYKRASQLGTERVLIVGSGSSGTQVCRDLCESSRFRKIHLATSNTRILPQRVLGVPIHRFLYWFGLFDVRAGSTLGRVMFSTLEGGGDPVVRPGPKDLSREYGVTLHGRLTEVGGTTLSFSDRTEIDTSDLAVIWCTGFRTDFSWVEPLEAGLQIDDRGYPYHVRGEAVNAEGLYFLGLRYQHTVASHDIYGVGADAEYVADRIHKRLLQPGT